MVGGHATNAIDVTNCQPLTKPSNGVQDHSRDTELYHVCADVERAWNMGRLFNPKAALIDVFTSGQRGAFSKALNFCRSQSRPWSARHDGIAHSARREGRRLRRRATDTVPIIQQRAVGMKPGRVLPAIAALPGLASTRPSAARSTSARPS
jgi:hypothetical protein